MGIYRLKLSSITATQFILGTIGMCSDVVATMEPHLARRLNAAFSVFTQVFGECRHTFLRGCGCRIQGLEFKA